MWPLQWPGYPSPPPHPPTWEQTHICGNITFPKLCLQVVIMKSPTMSSRMDMKLILMWQWTLHICSYLQHCAPRRWPHGFSTLTDTIPVQQKYIHRPWIGGWRPECSSETFLAVISLVNSTAAVNVCVCVKFALCQQQRKCKCRAWMDINPFLAFTFRHHKRNVGSWCWWKRYVWTRLLPVWPWWRQFPPGR